MKQSVKENGREQGLTDKDEARKFAKEQARARKKIKKINQSINQINKSNKSTLFNEGDTQQSSTDKPVALEFLIELEF